MSQLPVIPDSSFYLCFLDDIKKPMALVRIFRCSQFQFNTGPIIKEEIQKSNGFATVATEIDTRAKMFDFYNYGEILKPVFSQEELKEGEHEVIAIAYVLHFLQKEFMTIIEDGKVKRFLKRTFPFILSKNKGTVGFVVLCCCQYEVFSRAEGIEILVLIGKSKFRIDKKILDKAIENVRGGSNIKEH